MTASLHLEILTYSCQCDK